MKHSSKIVRLLKKKRVNVTIASLTGNLWGLCDFEDRELFIKKSLSEKNKVKTLIHECLHFLYPKKRELWVLRIENEVFRALLKTEYEYLLNYIRRLSCQSKR